MRRELTDQAEAMARLRVQELGEELRGAGLLPPVDEAEAVAVVRPPGRHARAQDGLTRVTRLPERLSEQLRDRLGERIPFVSQHLTLLVAIAAAALVVVAWMRISASSEAVPVPRAKTGLPFPTPSASAPGAPASPSLATAVTGSVVVDVAGKVRHPGVITLPAGSRVIDAIKSAGGPQGGTDLNSLNLARVLVDGEQILVGVPATATAPAGASAGGGGTSATVSLNRATLEELESLPGVGPVTAQKILDYRASHGAFGSIDELLDIDGIGEKTLARLSPLVTL